MKLVVIREVYDTDPEHSYLIADVLLDGAILPVSIPIVEYLFKEK